MKIKQELKLMVSGCPPFKGLTQSAASVVTAPPSQMFLFLMIKHKGEDACTLSEIFPRRVVYPAVSLRIPACREQEFRCREPCFYFT